MHEISSVSMDPFRQLLPCARRATNESRAGESRRAVLQRRAGRTAAPSPGRLWAATLSHTGEGTDAARSPARIVWRRL